MSRSTSNALDVDTTDVRLSQEQAAVADKINLTKASLCLQAKSRCATTLVNAPEHTIHIRCLMLVFTGFTL